MKRILFGTLILALAGCQQEMARQPAYRPLQPSTLFADGLSARPLVPGTVHRDFEVVVWRKPVKIVGWERAASMVGQLPGNPLGATSAAATADLAIYVDTFPAPLTASQLKRGEDRFNIYCAVCHDRLATGKGMIVQRGFTPPPNLHTDLSRGFQLRGIKVKLTDAPVGYYFDVITRGFGAMPDYASQVPPADRWAIIAYIRALQLSQNATLAEVRDAKARQELLQQQEKKQ
jgi:mono/diheme cytochrome c family protein